MTREDQQKYVLAGICAGASQSSLDEKLDRPGRAAYIFEQLCKSYLKEVPKQTVARLDALRKAKVITSKDYAKRPPKLEGKKGRAYRFKKAWALSDLEKQVLKGFSEGLSIQQVSEILQISRSSVSTHASKAYTKLGVDNQVAAVHELRKFSLKNA